MTSLIRTSAVKIVVHDQKFSDDLEYTQTQMAGVIGKFSDFLMISRGEPFLDQDRLVTLEEVVERQRQYVPGGNPVEIKAHLSDFYKLTVKSVHNVASSYFLALCDSDSNIGQNARINKTTGVKNEIDPGKLLCRQMLDSGVFPIFPEFKDLLPGAFRRAAWTVALSAVKSWHEVNVTYCQKTEELQEELRLAIEKQAVLPEDILAMSGQWLETMEEVDRRIDRRYLSKWKNIRKSILEGKDQGFDEILYLPFRELWEDKDYISTIVSTYVLEKRLENRAPYARFSNVGNENAPIVFSVNRHNYSSILLGQDGDAFTATVSLLDSAEPGKICSWSLRTLRSGYFTDLDVKTAGGVCRIRFAKGNKDRVRVEGEVKEPRIQRRGGEFYLDIIHGLTGGGRSVGELLKENEKLVWFFQGAKSSKLTTEDMISLAEEGSLRVASVDLGINPLVSYSIYELGTKGQDADSIPVEGVGSANLIVQGQGGMIKSEYVCRQYKDLIDRMKRLKTVIRHRRAIVNGKLSNHPRYVNSIISALESFGQVYTEDDVFLKRFCLDELWEIRSLYQKLRNSRHRWVGIAADQVYWAGVVREWIRLLKTWKYGGRKPVDEEEKSLRGWVRTTDFQRYYKYLNAYKKDLIKKVAASIRHFCVEHGVKVLLLEDLEGFRFSVEQDKGTNNLLEIWSPNTILRWIQNAVEAHGIYVVSIDPRDTSRIDPQTGEYGYRSRFAKEFLVVRRGGQPVLINSDLAATQNLQHRFWTNYSRLSSCKVRVNEAEAVAIPEKPGVRVAAYFKKYGADVICDGQLSKTVRPGDLEFFLEGANSEETRLYYHAGWWLSQEEHWSEVDRIFDDLKNKASDSAEARSYVGRVKALSKKPSRKGVLSGA